MSESHLLLRLLWERWGSPDHPAEWDGQDGNGGKGSQRFWEYLWAIKQLQPFPLKLLDVGCGETQFFADLLSTAGVKTWRVDPAVKYTIASVNCFKLTLEEFVSQNKDDFDWVTCISVLEHVADKPAFCRALDSFDAPIVLTFEYGPGGIEQKAMYECLSCFKSHYISTMERCPVWADNSKPDMWRPLGIVLLPIK